MSIFGKFVEGLISGITGDSRESEECPNCGETLIFKDSELLGWEKYICPNCGNEYFEDDLNVWKDLEDDWNDEHETYLDMDEDDPYE